MRTSSNKSLLLPAVCLLLAGSLTFNTATAQTKPASPPHKAAQKTPSEADTAQADADDQDTSNDELEEAAVKLDVSRSSPLIQKLYQATRDTKEQDILGRLTEAKKLLADGADVITTDGQLSIVELGAIKPNILNPITPTLQTRPTESSK